MPSGCWQKRVNFRSLPLKLLSWPFYLNSSLFCIYFTLLLPLFSFSFPFLFHSPFSFHSPFFSFPFLFIPLSTFFFYIFPLFSLPIFIFFPPNDIGWCPPAAVKNEGHNWKICKTLGGFSPNYLLSHHTICSQTQN